MEIKVEATTKDLRKTQKGTAYTGVKIEGGGWVNIYGNHLQMRGQTLQITEPKSYAGTGDTKWASVVTASKPDPAPPPSPPASKEEAPDKLKGFERTTQQYLTEMDIIHLHVKKLEPDSPEARAALINNAMTLWIDGKIV